MRCALFIFLGALYNAHPIYCRTIVFMHTNYSLSIYSACTQGNVIVAPKLYKIKKRSFYWQERFDLVFHKTSGGSDYAISQAITGMVISESSVEKVTIEVA